MLERKRDEWKTVPLNVAVIGGSCVGKSSFINAIRRLTADDKGAAALGVKECTITSYPHPNNPLLMFWDLPGVGTDIFPRATYLTDIDVDHYDFFLLITAHGFTENDTWLGNELGKRNKKYFFVRTKVAKDIANNKKAHPKMHSEEKVITEIRESTEKHLRASGCEDVPVFLIDSYKPWKFQFNELEHHLIEEFPKIKKRALILSLHATSKEMIQRKVAELRSQMWKLALCSGGVAAIPLPGLSMSFDLTILGVEARLYFNQLGLDEVSLKRYAKLTCTDHEQLQAIVCKHLGFKVISVEGIKALIELLLRSAAVAAEVAEEVGKFIPVNGSVIAAPISFGGTHYSLKLILDKMESVALEVIHFATESAIAAEESDDD